MFWRGRHKFAYLELIPGGESLGLGQPQNGGRIYYVNNISGSSANNGLSWRTPFAQPSESISASETFRELGGRAPTVTTNDYVANTILIQGTNTYYTGITDLGERCNIIGVSAGLMRDNGSGQVRIGSLTTDGCDDASNARGNTIYNIQFTGGGDTMYAFRNTAWIQRSRFQDVVFMQMASALEGTFYAAACSGSIFERCHFASNSGGTAALYGFECNGQFSDNLVVDCVFAVGSTALMRLGSGSHQVNTVIEYNKFMGNSAVGFLDESADGYAMLVNNYFPTTAVITDLLSRTTNTRTVNNWGAAVDTMIDS